MTLAVPRVDVAMTGELAFAGTIEPVGGITAKILGACRARMSTVLLSSSNEAEGRSLRLPPARG